VEAALRLEVFSRVRFEIFGGVRGLNRQVRWVHPVEVPDIARFLNGGEMLVTAGLGIARDAEEQRRYLRAVAGAGASVLILELSGRAYGQMPRALVEEADRLDFPLIGLHGELPFVEVSAQVHARLVDDRVRELTAYDQLNKRLMELLLAGRDHVSFTGALAAEVTHPVVLEDSSRRVVAYSAGDDTTDDEVGDWDRHSWLMHRHATSSAPTEKAALAGAHADRGVPIYGRRCTRRAIAIRGERWGWLHVLHGPQPLRRQDEYALDRTAEAIAISVLSARDLKARAARRENALVDRLLLGDISGEEFVARALRLGKVLRGVSLLAVWTARGPSAEDTAQELLAASCAAVGLETITADVGDDALAVVGLQAPEDHERLRERLELDGPRAGMSRVCGPAELSTAIRQARSAASVAGASPATGAVRFDELGVLRLLVALSQGPELANYVDDELGPVLQHDAGSPNPLLPTLRAYLECDANKSRAAERLFVQRRTLYYRLERLNVLLARRVDDPEVRQNLSFALRGLDLIRRGDAQAVQP
jgi:purine catabolism regulator